MALASQSHGRDSGRGTEGPAGRDYWVFDNGATNRITRDARNVYAWVDIPPEKRKFMVDDGKAMRVIVVGRLNLRIHSKTSFDANFVREYM